MSNKYTVLHYTTHVPPPSSNCHYNFPLQLRCLESLLVSLQQIPQGGLHHTSSCCGEALLNSIHRNKYTVLHLTTHVPPPSSNCHYNFPLQLRCLESLLVSLQQIPQGGLHHTSLYHSLSLSLTRSLRPSLSTRVCVCVWCLVCGRGTGRGHGGRAEERWAKWR